MVILEPSSTAFALGMLSRRASGSFASFIRSSHAIGRRTSCVSRWFSSSPELEADNHEAITAASVSSAAVPIPAERRDYETTFHAPVMWKECITALLDSNGFSSRLASDTNNKSTTTTKPVVFVDGTLGGGGHTMALLEHLTAGDIVIGCDRDASAIETASERLSDYLGSQSENLPLFVPVQGNFCDLSSLLPNVLNPITKTPILGSSGHVDGILLDLGVSSHQIDNAARGFAFMRDGPLDMRMSNSSSSFTAADICNEFDVDELSKILRDYGDEKRARAIAKSIVKHRPMKTTNDLVSAVADVTPEFSKHSRRMGRNPTLARIFQSIRIVVNEEDKSLSKALMEMCPTLIRPGGRLVVLSYHSMEDRATKRVMRDGNVELQVKEKDIYGNVIGDPMPFKPVGKPTKASEEEVLRNPRARSATLRVAERLKS